MSESALRTELAALADRVSALEHARSTAPSDPTPPGARRAAGSAEPPPGIVDTALIERLQGRSGPPFEDGQTQGSVLYAGVAQVRDASYVWQMERPVPGLLATDDHLIAETLAAVASPARLKLLKAVLAGATETHELHAALGEVSTGQLYHHLKELTAAGLVVQHGRGRYRVSPHCVVPLLAVIAAAHDLAHPDQPPAQEA